jgi:hypothetical protein
LPYRELFDDDIRALLHAEIDERLTAADDFTAVAIPSGPARCGPRLRCSSTYSEMSEPRARLKSCCS